MKRAIIGILIIGIISIFSGCAKSSSQAAESGFKSIKPVEAKKMLESEKGIVLLDVRTEPEYNEGHIPGSTLIPLDLLLDKVEGKIPNKDTKILIYCRSGNRSKQAAEMLTSKGYKNVYDLGGIISWPYEVEK